MSTTSKLGADMTEQQIQDLIGRLFLAGRHPDFAIAMGAATALQRLARQPAAIDKQAEAKAADFMVEARNAQMFQDVRELISTFTDPKANCPGRHLEAQRVLPLLDAFLGEGYTGRVLSFKRALERAESEGPEFEDGPDESGFKGPRPWNGFQDDKQPLTDHRIWEIADLVWQRKSITTDRGFELDFAHEVIAAALHEVRAASTPANVAQGAEAVAIWRMVRANLNLIANSFANCKGSAATMQDLAKDCLTKVDAYLDAAPPAQHKSDWHPDFVTALYDNADPDKRYTMDQMREYADAFHRSRIDAAPPAQTALTDDARDAARYRWLRQGKSVWVKVPVKDRHVEYFIGHKPEPKFAECFDKAIDAALTAAQSASGDTK